VRPWERATLAAREETQTAVNYKFARQMAEHMLKEIDFTPVGWCERGFKPLIATFVPFSLKDDMKTFCSIIRRI
jgi:hypothetical protein